ncbi:MAG: PLP-dependent aminotransferase family protein [Methylocystaceae bacterium]
MTNFPSGNKLSPSASEPLYLQLAAIIAEQIYQGALTAGTKLPPERELALQFSVSRTTAINAYRHLDTQGLVVSKIGSGTYVAYEAPAHPEKKLAMPWEQLFSPHLDTPMSSILRDLVDTPTANQTISLAAGMPDPAFYPLDIFNEILTREFRSIDPSDLGHIPTEGLPALRRVIAARSQAKGIASSPENVLILTGSQQGIYLINRIFIEPGDYVVVEAPTYIGAIQAFQAAGARILSLPAADHISMELMEDYLTRYRPKLFYTVTTFQNPKGSVMTLEERKALLQLAARYRMIIVEDEPYGELYYDAPPPPSLKALDEYNCVLYLGTFSKVLFPGLRTGWLEGPPLVINRLAQEKQYIDLHTNNLTQWLLACYLQGEHLDYHLVKVRKEYKQRRDAMVSAIRRYCRDEVSFTIPEGGFYLWCRLNRQVSSRTLAHEAMKAGVSIVPGEAFYANRQGNHEMRLCYVTHEAPLLTEGIKRLSRLIARLPEEKSSPDAAFHLNPLIV